MLVRDGSISEHHSDEAQGYDRPRQAQNQSPVAVIVPTYNRANYIAQCLASVLGQTMPPAQVIVVDDGSIDGTSMAVAPYRERIEYLKKENGGKSTALNLALRHTRQPYIWIFDDDDIALPDAIERHISVLGMQQDAGFSFSGFHKLRFDGERWRIGSKLYEFDMVSEGETFISLLLGCSIAQQGMMVRRKCYDEIGPFDDKLIRAQDYDMLLRLSQRYRAARVEGATFYLRVHDGARGSALDRHSADQRDFQWHKYEKIIFQRLASTLPLSAYLPQEHAGNSSNDPVRRRALLQRAAALARRGLWADALSDLRSVTALCSCAPFTLAEENLFVAMMEAPLAVQEMLAGKTYFREIIRLLDVPGLGVPIRSYFARGLYHSLVEEVREGRYTSAARITGAIIEMAGLSGLQNGFHRIVRKRLLSS